MQQLKKLCVVLATQLKLAVCGNNGSSIDTDCEHVLLHVYILYKVQYSVQMYCSVVDVQLMMSLATRPERMMS